jgi:SpoVK/Ycf46/Vps4 family AAA+-type ATPase
VIAATNRPFDLDEAALRRLTKRIFIGLPDAESRMGQIKKLMKQVECQLAGWEIDKIIQMTNGYSSADLASLCKDAAMEPLREIPPNQIMQLKGAHSIRKVMFKDFEKALKNIRPTVSNQSLREYADWHRNTGGV